MKYEVIFYKGKEIIDVYHGFLGDTEKITHALKNAISYYKKYEMEVFDKVKIICEFDFDNYISIEIKDEYFFTYDLGYLY